MTAGPDSVVFSTVEVLLLGVPKSIIVLFVLAVVDAAMILLANKVESVALDKDEDNFVPVVIFVPIVVVEGLLDCVEV